MDSKQISEIINRVIEASPHKMTKSEAREVLIAAGVLGPDGEIKKGYEWLLVKVKSEGKEAE